MRRPSFLGACRLSTVDCRLHHSPSRQSPPVVGCRGFPVIRSCDLPTTPVSHGPQIDMHMVTIGRAMILPHGSRPAIQLAALQVPLVVKLTGANLLVVA